MIQTVNTQPSAFEGYLGKYGQSRLGTFAGNVASFGIKNGMTQGEVVDGIIAYLSSKEGKALLTKLVKGATTHIRKEDKANG